MKAVSYIEIDVPRCTLSYGVGACPAVLGVDSAIKCHNSLGTCPVRASFDEEPVTLRFAVPANYLPRDIEAWPSIADIAFTPAILSLGKDLGTRSTLKVTFEDHPWADTGPLFDKYLDERSTDPWMTGSFWPKFRARNPFLRGRALRWIQGLEGQPLAEMDTRHFLIEGYEGPDDSGRTTIVAKDALRMADGDRAQAPLLSPGRLNAGIAADAETATLAPSGVGNASYPALGYLNTGGKEIVGFTRSGDTLSLTRAQFNTEAQAHAAGDRAQLCLHYNAEDPADIIADLLTNYAGVDAGLIPLAGWQAETGAYYRRVNTALIAEPTAVKTLVNELIEQDGLALWWDDEGRRLRLQVLRAIATDAELFVDGPGGNIVEGTLRVRVQDEKRISRVWTYFGQFNPLKSVEDTDNYRSSALTADDDDAILLAQPATKKIFARWIPFGGLTTAQRVNDIQMGRYLTAPRHFTWQVFRRGNASPTMGEGVRIQGLSLQTATGEPETVPVQIIRVEPRDDVYVIEAEEMRFVEFDDGDLTTRSVIIDTNAYNLNARALHDALYPLPTSGDTIDITINAGVTVGSLSSGLPAFEIGDWPSGVIVNLYLNGRIQGYGGKGGQGGNAAGAGEAAWGKDGENGSVALYSRYAFSLLAGDDAKIFGGAGGGAGGPGGGNFWDNYRGGGGGGGAGSPPGTGGAPGSGAGDAAAGGNATPDAGGAGGADISYRRGVAGGDPGEAGLNSAQQPGGTHVAQGGSAGAAIDGVSFVTVTGSPDIRGPQVS